MISVQKNKDYYYDVVCVMPTGEQIVVKVQAPNEAVAMEIAAHVEPTTRLFVPYLVD